VLTVREIWRFPVKSIGGEQLQTAEVDEQGIAGDRSWGVRDDESGMILTARRQPRLLMATATLDADRPVITTVDGARLTTSAEVSQWLERPVTLVAPGSTPPVFEGVSDIDHERDWDTWEGTLGTFHDGRSKLSMVSARSLGEFDRRRFRINLVLDSDDPADDEDALLERDVAVGGVTLFMRKTIERCVMVTRAQPGLPADLGVLKQVIRERANQMGIGAVVTAPGVISVGDTVAPAGLS
jgi:uncharacterized protein YcbX